MPGTRCTVVSCNNSLAKTGKSVRYHRFPRNKSIRRLWEQRCGRDGSWNPGACHICSDHFSEDCYERDLRSELLGEPIKKRLKKCSIPTRKLPSTEYDEPHKRSTEFENQLKEITEQQLRNQEQDCISFIQYTHIVLGKIKW